MRCFRDSSISLKVADAVVVPSSSCVAMMAGSLSEDGGRRIGRAELIAVRRGFAAEVFEFSEFFDEAAGAGGCGGLLSASGDVSRELSWVEESGVGRWADAVVESGAGDRSS